MWRVILLLGNAVLVGAQSGVAIEFCSAVDFGLEGTADVLARGFSDYFVKVPFTVEKLLGAARSDSVDFSASRIAVADGTAVGAALIARRGWTSRLAGMAIVPEARRQGVGRALVHRVLEDAKNRGDRTMVLEVVEQNEPAVALYEGCGFKKQRRLVGFSTQSESGFATAGLAEVDLRAAGEAMTLCGVADLPWQLSGETVAHLTPPNAAFRLDGAWVATSSLSASEVSIHAVAGVPGAEYVKSASGILYALGAKFPGKRWTMKAVWPEELGEVFSAVGFTRTPLSQWQMIVSLSWTSAGSAPAFAIVDVAAAASRHGQR